MSRPAVLAKVAAVTVVVLAAFVASSLAAGAHVGTATEAQGGGVTKVTFSFIHGCGELPTDSLRIQIPQNVTGVTPEDPSGWISTLEGNELAWNGGPATDGVKTEFVATMTVVGAAGETVFFPTLQGCPGGEENAWIDRSDDPEADQAAPRILLTETAASIPTTSTTVESGLAGTAPTSEPARTTVPTSAPGAAAAPREISYTETRSNAALIIYSTIIALGVIGVGAFVLSKRGSSKP